MTPIPQNILDEIKKHDTTTFKVLGLDHGAVTNAVAFLLSNSMEDMAKHLRQMAQAGFIRQGPLDGFVAAGVILDEGEFILLSNGYQEYNTSAEMMASLVHEIGFLAAFQKSAEENEMRSQQALLWLSKHKPVVDAPSFITSAALKMERMSK